LSKEIKLLFGGYIRFVEGGDLCFGGAGGGVGVIIFAFY